ncbi:MAG: T9SS type A sorting domain-containing protein [Rhodothermaceae bacterium]|nr:T9SS type A sorting domain-containing protein [Rhodothermaceae bacterium]
MFFDSVDFKRVFVLVILALFVHESHAQKRFSPNATTAVSSASGVERAGDVDVFQLNSQLPVDTLRNYIRGDGSIFGYFANNQDQTGGWVHGTNSFNDVAKATRISLPEGVTGATLTEVLVTFIYKASTITNQTYSIEIRDVSSTGAPGNLLDFEDFNMSDINGDDDFATDAFPTSHLFSEGVNVPQEFFVIVNFGTYVDTDYQNVAIAASPNLGRFIEEDWELLSDGTWINMSESWFPDNPNDGWYMWIDAVINTDVSFNDPNEPNNTASNAIAMNNGFVSSGAAIFPVGDVDYYSFNGVAGTTVDVFAQADLGGDVELDGVITIYNSAGDFIADNDDFNGSFTESRVILTLTETDTYFARYAAFDNDTSNDFPNKREAEADDDLGGVRSSMRSFLSGSFQGGGGDQHSVKSNQIDDIGGYTLRFTVTGGGDDTTVPVIQHTPPAITVPQGQDIIVQSEITDPGTGVANAFIAYLEGGRSANDALFSVMTLVSGNTYEATIPANFVNERGLQYVIAATDGAGNEALGNVVNLQVRFEEGLSRPVSITGTTENSYRIVSMPLNLDNNSVRGVLEDDFGTYDPEVWRFWELGSNQSYSEFPVVGNFAPGNAYWFATSQTGRSITTGSGSTVSLEFLAEIPLSPGWTFIGTPFNFPIVGAQVALESGTIPDIRTFTGSWASLSGGMMPFQGYAVASVSADVLQINPFLPTVGKTGATAAKVQSTEYHWAISISASSGDVQDNDNLLAVSKAASGGWDGMDRPEPPVIGDYISLYFPHNDWDVPFSHFNTDVRPEFEGSQQWSFEVATNQDGPIELAFMGIDSVPSEYEVHLVDRQMHHRQNLRESSTYTMRGREQDIEGRFVIVVGKSEFVAEELKKLAALPESMAVVAYPNPFQSYMTLELGLPESSDVSIDVYDLLGKRVTTLMRGESLNAGTHAVQWSGDDAIGRPLANGIYVFAIQTRTSRITKKVVLLR